MKRYESAAMVFALILNAAAIISFQMGIYLIPALPLFVASLAIVSWVIGRSSELVVVGLEGLALDLGFPSYSMGVLSSLASTIPELTMTLMAVATGIEEMIEIAVIASLSSVGIGILLLSLVTFISSFKTGKASIEVPREVLTEELNAVVFTLSAYLVLSLLASAHLVLGDRGSFMPRGVGFILTTVYLSYLIRLFFSSDRREDKGKVKREGSVEKSRKGSFGRSSVLVKLLVGLIGIFFAGWLIVSLTENLVSRTGFQLVHAALALAAVGTIPEHGVAIVSAVKGKTELAFGNSIGGLTQIALLVVGLIASLTPVPIDAYVTTQFAVTSASMLMLKFFVRDDGKIDIGEALMMVALQILAFDVLLSA
ncbi:MAG TPA: hypothetical protein EYP68_04340 [Candidatus Korarchaeota archaeon]|nr:hypothetical protein [Candidatus Korarchaeota archaeon]